MATCSNSPFPQWLDNPAGPEVLWSHRKTILKPLDQSGVWRFRELLPPIPEEHAITLREGNTPLYEMPRCAKIAGVDTLQAKHQGMNPTASFKDTGMTFAASSGTSAGISLGRVRLHRQHLGVDGRLRRPRQHAQPGADS